jgi:hypothetical protein
MKLFKTDSKGNFSIVIDGIEVESLITIKMNLESDSLPVLANNTLSLVITRRIIICRLSQLIVKAE